MHRWFLHIVILLLFLCANTFTNAQTDLIIKRSYDEVLSKKYTGKNFKYTPEKVTEPIEDDKEIEEAINKWNGMNLSWIGNVFVVLLILFLAIILIKAFYGSNFKLTNKKKAFGNNIDIVEEEEIDIRQNFQNKLKSAIESKDYRLATRYYYLQTLKDLSTKKIIDFHIEKTNSDYQYEIKNQVKRKAFKSISRIYDYIWYGKFKVDEDEFKKIQYEFDQFTTLIK